MRLIFRQERLMLGNEPYVRLCRGCLSRRGDGDGLKMPSGVADAESYVRLHARL